MIKFSVATNWDDNLIKEIDILDTERKVTEVFGKLASDFIGGARPSYILNNISKKKAAHHIGLVKRTGRKFNYLLNATCMDNREFTRTGQREIRKLISWLDDLKVDAITVANPYLGYLIRKQNPKFKLTVSAQARVDSVRKIEFWIEEIGVNKVNLSGRGIVRNFPLLKKIRSQTSCELQLIANQLCLHDCPIYIYHITFASHASQSRHPLRGFGINWCKTNCRYRMFTQPEELIKSDWVRPEDVGYYENVGINSLKVLERSRDTQGIIYTLKAYLERRFDRNLTDLFISPKNKPSKKILLLNFLRYFFHPLHINIFKLWKFRKVFPEVGIHIDNRKLDGFLEYFFEGKCQIDNCKECGYCRGVAERAVRIDNAFREKMERESSDTIESFTNGEMFRYF